MSESSRFEGLSEDEKWQLLTLLLKEGKGPRAGRPRKDGSTLTWRDFGFTRKWVYNSRLLAELPKDAIESYFKDCTRDGRRPSNRGLLVKHGLQENVPDENVFQDTPAGDLAESLLQPFERIAGQMTRRQRRLMIRALRVRLRLIDQKAEMCDFPEKSRNGKPSERMHGLP